MSELEKVNDLMKQVLAFRIKKAEIDKQRKDNNAELEAVSQELATILEANNLPSFKNEYGNFSYTTKQTYRVPKMEEDREKFFGYLREKGIFDSLATVNSQTLQSFCKQEMDIQEEQGNYDFQVPGIDLGEPQTTYRFTVGRKS